MGYGFSSRSGRTASTKSMHGYESHAWNDALSIATFLVDTYSRTYDIRKFYEETKVEEYAEAIPETVGEFLGLSESRRPAFLKKLPNDVTRIGFLVACVIACQRVVDLVRLRDAHAHNLAPGGGYRTTSEGLYAFYTALRRTHSYAWPFEVFDALSSELAFDERFDAPLEDAIAEVLQATASVAVTATESTPASNSLTEVVSFSQSTRHAIAPDGSIVRGAGMPFWRMAIQSQTQSFGIVYFFATKPSSEEIAQIFESITFAPDVPTDLMVPASLKNLLEQPPQKMSSTVRIRALAGSGFRQPQLRWVDDYVDDLDLELAILGEKPVLAKELVDLPDHSLDFQGLHDLDDHCDFGMRRAILVRAAFEVCSIRNRWNGPLPTTAEVEALHAQIDDGILGTGKPSMFKKEQKKLARYEESGRLSPLGEFLYQTAALIETWREDPRCAGSRLEAIADLVINEWRRNRNSYYGSRLSNLLEEPMPEMDIVARAVFQRLSRPVPRSLFRMDKVSCLRTGGLHIGYGGSTDGQGALGGYVAQFWVSVEAEVRDPAIGALAFLPVSPAIHDRLSDALTNAVRDLGVRVAIHPRFKSFDNLHGRESRQGFMAMPSLWEVLRDFDDSSLLGTAKTGWYKQAPSTDSDLRLLITATSDTAEPLTQISVHWSKLKQQLLSFIEEHLSNNSLPPSGLTLGSTLERFIDPYVAHHPRSALISGATWKEPRASTASQAR